MSYEEFTIGRRTFLRVVGASGVASLISFYGCGTGQRSRANGKRVVVIGIDGMDPRLSERLMDAGKMPNFARLRDAGGYSPLGTSVPPQSPVAWANFITGAGPGVHGIFDFIHRDPSEQCRPYYSASETVGALEGWEVGEYRLPLNFWPFNHGTTQTLLKREGTPFWDYLDQAGIPSWFYDIPSNYPPSKSVAGNHHCLAGMGTPDVLGSYGTYQLFSSRQRREQHEPGGIRKPLRFANHVAKATLTGPTNSLLKQPKETAAEFTIFRHPEESLCRIELQGHALVLREQEWSDWLPIDFTLKTPAFLPDDNVTGICRFYLQQVRPYFKLYVSPVNINPEDPGNTNITEPANFATQIADELGLFPTAGFQEDHKALSNGVFSDEEYRVQADYVLEERLRLLDFALKNYDDGLLFFYFSSTDLQAHMFFWDSDEPHPVRDSAAAKKYMRVIEDLYARMDAVLGNLLQRFDDDTTLMVLSDHGFCNFRRQFNLNTWLRDQGYLGPPTCRSLLNPTRAPLVDWHSTRAYGLGLNGLYLNLRGRERDGIVNPLEKDALIDELRQKLLAVRDPDTGEQAIEAVYRTDEVYSGPQAKNAPDLILGYRRGYRCSWETALGDIMDDVFSNNPSAWSADHCMATETLPGILFTNRPLAHKSPALTDLAPTILREFGIKTPTDMIGRPVFKT